MGKCDQVRTGIYGLDALLLGGIRRGNIVLIEGVTGTGKTLFGTEFIYRGITEFNEPGIIVVFETIPQKLVQDTEAFAWDLEGLQRQNKLKIIFTTPKVLKEELQSEESLLVETANEIGARRIFIDGISLFRFAAESTDVEYRDSLYQLMASLNRQNLTTLVSHEVVGTSEDRSSLHIAEFLADTVITLERERMELGVHRSLEIVKSRGQGFDSGKHTLMITEGVGLQIFRRVQLPLRRDFITNAPQPSSDQYVSAIGEESLLDSLLGGGLFRGSTTLTVGVSGVGKSILGMQFLIEGAVQNNESGLLISLDEHPEQIRRNARMLNLGLNEGAAGALIHLFHESPQEIEIDAHFNRLSEFIIKNNVQRLVIDGMTSYAMALKDQRVYRDFFHTLVDFCKSRLMIALFSYETTEVFGITHFMPDHPVSSIVDNIIVMNFVELGNELRRSIAVAKSRGRKNRFMTHEFVVGPGGISIISEDAPGLPVVPFSRYYGLLSRAPTRLSPELALSNHSPADPLREPL